MRGGCDACIACSISSPTSMMRNRVELTQEGSRVRVTNTLIGVSEDFLDGTGVQRERRLVEHTEGLHCRTAHPLIAVREQAHDGTGVQLKLRLVEVAEETRSHAAQVIILVREHANDGTGMWC